MEPLSAEQVAHFCREGFVVVPGVLAGPRLDRARDLFWETLGAGVPWLRRGDPSSWLRQPRVAARAEHTGEDPRDGGYLTVFDGEVHTASSGSAGAGAAPVVSTTGLRFFCADIGAHPALLDLLPRHPLVRAAADQLLGAGTYCEEGMVRADTRKGSQGRPTAEATTRGVYCTLPQGDAPAHREAFVGGERG
jgi:hypothetical protein